MNTHSPVSTATPSASAAPQPATRLPAQELFPVLSIVTAPLRRWITAKWTFVQKHPVLSSLAALLLLTVLIVKGLALRASWLDNEAAFWFRSRGGSTHSNAKSGHVIVGIISEVVMRQPLEGRLTSHLRIPSSIVRHDSEEMYVRLSQFPRLDSIAFDTSIPQPSQKTVVIDSQRLQQTLLRMPGPLSLSINDHSLSPTDTPLHLTNKIYSLALHNVHITRDFARGLPILKRLRYLMISNALIDDDAVDILLERLGSNRGHIVSSQMSETTYAKLAARNHFNINGYTRPGASTAAPATSATPAKTR